MDQSSRIRELEEQLKRVSELIIFTYKPNPQSKGLHEGQARMAVDGNGEVNSEDDEDEALHEDCGQGQRVRHGASAADTDYLVGEVSI